MSKGFQDQNGQHSDSIDIVIHWPRFNLHTAPLVALLPLGNSLRIKLAHSCMSLIYISVENSTMVMYEIVISAPPASYAYDSVGLINPLCTDKCWIGQLRFSG